jgi:8-hydroxy-5-deazaflavin:NADPH oxidoreductase
VVASPLSLPHATKATRRGWQRSSARKFVQCRQAIADADAVVFAVWLDTLRALVVENADLLKGKVVLDSTNPIKVDGNGALVRSLPEGQSSGSLVAGLLPPAARNVKAFGSLGAASFAGSANRSPRRAVLFYATDDTQAAATAERLISAAGYDAVQAGGLRDVARVEGPDGKLSQGGLGGTCLIRVEQRAIEKYTGILVRGEHHRGPR